MSARIADLLSEGMKVLGAAGIEAPGREARLLLAIAAKVPPAVMIGFPERPVDDSGVAGYRELVRRRADREPVSHLTGEREFWSLPFFVSRDVLDPRPDSEALIAAVLGEVGDRGADLRILDLGTGSGCLLLTLLRELPNALGWAIDLSAAALAIAGRNAARLGLGDRVAFREGAWTAALTAADPATFDLIVSNPPYIPSGDIAGLAPEVARHEPRLALDGGMDGLEAYRGLAPLLWRHLAPDGLVALEIGLGQAESVSELMTAAGLVPAGRARDLAGRERCLLFRRP
ncbi:release factor glutamine methyltransferase [Dongia mobilis]|uniref:Release factor glutamine methyltransferase n=1 Tax=Dongia mobilis TaxID=578943 RepID=A0A4R6WKK3_9PROT|nr:peptide chain release factor N(5)-glutamine methyltransferase [Dongia mobilis]TDQ78761.1 release factor glutamine methyltransferase [Dongia mobilis]